jgi:hypothetical protein
VTDAPDTFVDEVSGFFDELAARGHEPLLSRARGTLRFDVAEPDRTGHWYLGIDRGAVHVSRAEASADAVVRLSGETMAGLANGTVNAWTALLRGEVHAEGDLGLLVLFQRVFPAAAARNSADPGPRGRSRS